MAEKPKQHNPNSGVRGEGYVPQVWGISNASEGNINMAEFFRPSQNRSSEERLCLAMIYQAIEDRDVFWIAHKGHEDKLLAFDTCCEALGLNADYVRKGALKFIAFAKKNKTTPFRLRKRGKKYKHMNQPKEVYFSHNYNACNNLRGCAECEFREAYTMTFGWFPYENRPNGESIRQNKKI